MHRVQTPAHRPQPSVSWGLGLQPGHPHPTSPLPRNSTRVHQRAQWLLKEGACRWWARSSDWVVTLALGNEEKGEDNLANHEGSYSVRPLILLFLGLSLKSYWPGLPWCPLAENMLCHVHCSSSCLWYQLSCCISLCARFAEPRVGRCELRVVGDSRSRRYYRHVYSLLADAEAVAAAIA